MSADHNCYSRFLDPGGICFLTRGVCLASREADSDALIREPCLRLCVGARGAAYRPCVRHLLMGEDTKAGFTLCEGREFGPVDVNGRFIALGT